MHGKLLILIVALVFIAPFFIYINTKAEIDFFMPHIVTGDEPHYLVMTSSIIKDFDLELENNYINAENGAGDVGFNYINKRINHHTILINQDKTQKEHWGYYYNLSDANLSPLHGVNISGYNEYPARNPGLPLFSAIFLWPFKYSRYIDSAAIFLTIITSLIGFIFLYKLLYYFNKNKRENFVIVLMFMFATHAWFYAKTFYAEPYIATFLIISYYYFITRKEILIPCFIMGIIFLMKTVSILFYFIFALYLVANRRFKDLILFSIPIMVAASLLLLYNYILFKDVFYSPIGYVYGDIFSGFFKMFFSLKRGLLIYSPFLIFGLIGFYHFYEYEKKDLNFNIVNSKAIFTLLLFIVYILFISSQNIDWTNVDVYGARHAAPVTPLLSIPLIFWRKKCKNLFLEKLFFILLGISFIIGLYSVWGHPQFVIQGLAPLQYHIYVYKDLYLF